jgi:hypothetical protein
VIGLENVRAEGVQGKLVEVEEEAADLKGM